MGAAVGSACYRRRRRRAWRGAPWLLSHSATVRWRRGNGAFSPESSFLFLKMVPLVSFRTGAPSAGLQRGRRRPAWRRRSGHDAAPTSASHAVHQPRVNGDTKSPKTLPRPDTPQHDTTPEQHFSTLGTGLTDACVFPSPRRVQGQARRGAARRRHHRQVRCAELLPRRGTHARQPPLPPPRSPPEVHKVNLIKLGTPVYLLFILFPPRSQHTSLTVCS